MTAPATHPGEGAGPRLTAGWLEHGLIDDIRPMLFAARDQRRMAALATIVAADGGPRPVGSQMLVTDDDYWGFLSGGCVEADVALHARRVLADGEPVRLVYGRGSPFVDMRLPCGGRIELLVEAIGPDDAAVGDLRRSCRDRVPALWSSDGVTRRCLPAGKVEAPASDERATVRFDPPWRLRVIGEDPFALAIAAMGRSIGMETRLLAPFASAARPPLGLEVDRRGVAASLADEPPDAWTAIVLATHDVDLGEDALVRIVGTDAGYIGVLGARRRIPDRQRRLRDAGCSAERIARVHMPIGLTIGARSPWEIAVSAIAEIIAARRAPPA